MLILVGSEEGEDLYDGFNYSIDMPTGGGALTGGSNFSFGGSGAASFSTAAGANNFGAPPSTAFRGAPPGTAMNRNITTGMRLTTAAALAGASGSDARPMTSVKGAGFSTEAKAKAAFDPLNQGTSRGPAPPLAAKGDNSPEEAAKELEKAVHKLLEESAHATHAKDHMKALERAKEAVKKERMLCKHRESNGLGEQVKTSHIFII
jgi:intraflagellar transport protein 88